MSKRILVTGAGSSAGENLLRSLRGGDPSFHLVGANDDRFILRKSSAESRYLIPRAADPRFADVLPDLLERERIDLVIPTTDAEVGAVSDLREEIPGRSFLPDPEILRLCRDKHELTAFLRSRGIAAPETRPVADVDGLAGLFTRFGDPTSLWCRPRSGTCARGGSRVRSPEEARRWIRLWGEMGRIPADSFTLSEYLPGREILCQSLWRDGQLILTNTFERLSYFGVDNIPSGVTSLSSLAKTVIAPEAAALCARAVRTISSSASGAFSIDVKEDGHGVPHITEINAGRFFMAMTAFDRVLKHNISLTFVRVALGEPVTFREEYDAVEDYYMVRDLDTLPGIFHADDLLDGIVVAGG